jgi:hypothetical protein
MDWYAFAAEASKDWGVSFNQGMSNASPLNYSSRNIGDEVAGQAIAQAAQFNVSLFTQPQQAPQAPLAQKPQEPIQQYVYPVKETEMPEYEINAGMVKRWDKTTKRYNIV